MMNVDNSKNKNKPINIKKRAKKPNLAIGKGFSLLGDDAQIEMQLTLMRKFSITSIPAFTYMLHGQKVFNPAEQEIIEAEFAKWKKRSN